MKEPLDASFQVRSKRRTLATIAKFLTENGFRPRSKSELGRVALEILKDNLITGGLVDPIEDSIEATRFLESLGLGPLNIRGHEASYLKQLQIESIRPPLKLEESVERRIRSLIERREKDV